jgi:hypothetical protein
VSASARYGIVPPIKPAKISAFLLICVEHPRVRREAEEYLHSFQPNYQLTSCCPSVLLLSSAFARPRSTAVLRITLSATHPAASAPKKLKTPFPLSLAAFNA